MTEQPRAGGRFAPKAKPEHDPAEQQDERAALPPIPTPAHDKLAAMAAKRRASPDGFVVEPPVPLRMLNSIGQMRYGQAIIYNKQELTSKALIKHLEAWLEEVSKQGLPGDLESAWVAFNPALGGVKQQHRNIYDRLYPECMRRSGQLSLAKDRERLLLQARDSKLGAINAARDAFAEAVHHLEVEAPAEVEKRRQVLAELEAALWPEPEAVAA